jgi:hypothetical protein
MLEATDSDSRLQVSFIQLLLTRSLGGSFTNSLMSRRLKTDLASEGDAMSVCDYSLVSWPKANGFSWLVLLATLR